MKYTMCVAGAFALGPAYIISYLREQGHEVQLIYDPLEYSYGGTQDTFLSKILSVKEYNLRKIEEFNPDYCLFSVATAHYKWALDMAKQVFLRTGTKVIFGGIHPTCCPEEVKRHIFIHDICVGCGIKYFGGEFDPDKLLPARLDFYKELPRKDIIQPFIMTSYGCPYNCTYCMPKEYRIKAKRRSVDGCINELKWLKAHGAKRFAIWDDVFTIDKQWLFEFCKRVSSEIKMPFRCVTHPKLIDLEISFSLKQAGCYMIAIGIQSGSQWLRNTVLNRHETNEDFIHACKCVKEFGMKLLVDHIFSIPFEMNIHQKESMRLYRKANPDMVNVFDLVYFPKAKIIDHAITAGILQESDRERIDRAELPQYASGPNNIIAHHNPWVKKILAVPLKGKFWHYLPESAIKILVYGKIFLFTWKDCIPLTILENHLFYIKRRIQKCLSLR